MNKKRCKICILTDDIPGVFLNQEGFCNTCQKYFAGKKTTPRFSEREMVEHLRSKGKGRDYDCLCLFSGGKDSTFMLYTLVEKYSLRVLAFTFDNWFLSPQTLVNIEKVVSRLGVDHVVSKPHWPLALSVFLTGIRKTPASRAGKRAAFLIGHVCWPCFFMISLYSIKTAVEKNIPCTVAGGTPGQYRQKHRNLLSRYRGPVDIYRTMILPFYRMLDKPERSQFRLSLSEKLKASRVKLVPFYDYVPYDEKKIIESISKVLDWKKPADTDVCSSNCQLNALGIALHRKRYSLHPYLIPLAHDVRLGLVDRDEALKAVNSSLNQEILLKTAERLGLEAEEFL